MSRKKKRTLWYICTTHTFHPYLKTTVTSQHFPIRIQKQNQGCVQLSRLWQRADTSAAESIASKVFTEVITKKGVIICNNTKLLKTKKKTGEKKVS